MARDSRAVGPRDDLVPDLVRNSCCQGAEANIGNEFSSFGNAFSSPSFSRKCGC